MTNHNLIIPYKILDVEIHSSSVESLENIIESFLIFENSPQLITTFNLDFLRITTIDKDFQNICKNTLFNLPDGFGIISIIKKKYNKNVTRITGNDIFPLLLKLIKKHNKKIVIVGGTKTVSKEAEQKIIKQYKIPNDNLLCLSPEFKFEENEKVNEEIIAKVNIFKPDIVLAALGCPRQEKWLFKHMNKFGSKINIGIGATLDFFTGAKKRSPVFLQKVGLEWLWRLITEPKRLFKRYILLDLPFFIKIYFSKKN